MDACPQAGEKEHHGKNARQCRQQPVGLPSHLSITKQQTYPRQRRGL